MSRGRAGSVCTRTPAADAPAVRDFTLPISSSRRARTTSSETRPAATACICVRFGRLPRRQVLGNWLSPTAVYWSSSQKLACAQRMKPFSSSIRSGRVAPNRTSKVAGPRALADGLRMQEGRHHGLLHLAEAQTQESRWMSRARPNSPSMMPVQAGLLPSCSSRVGHGHAVRAWPPTARPARARSGKRRARPAGRRPILGLAQRQRERAQDASGPLEALQLGPLGVEDLGQVRVERIALQVAFLGIRPLFLGLLIDVEDALERRQDVRPERVAILDRLAA